MTIRIARNLLAAAAVAVLGLGAAPQAAQAQSAYVINGQIPPAQMQVQLYQMGLAPGAYVVDAYGNIAPVVVQPQAQGYGVGGYGMPSQPIDTFGRYGSGTVGPGGQTYYSNMVGQGGHGTDSNGCHYAYGWSNC